MTTIGAYAACTVGKRKKTKAAWGGTTVDYEAIAGKAVREMNTQDLQTFPYRVRARSGPVLSRIQSAAVACEGLQPCSYGRAIQN